MSSLDYVPELAAALDRLVPRDGSPRPDWSDVLSRAEVSVPVGRTRRGRRWSRGTRALVAIAALVLAVLVVGSALAALGRDPFGGLTSWLSGSPGKPAPAAEQAGFASRNGASYAAFPSGTRLRLLGRVVAGGETFDLLGFRSRSTLCLRVVRSDQAGGLGVNQCVTQRELRSSSAPALVASEASFPLGTRTGVSGVLGFADDSVRTIELRRLRGPRQSIRAVNNVFVALRRVGFDGGSPSEANPIVQVYAVTRDGSRTRVPFVAITTPPPRVPSYLRAANPAGLPGPTWAATTLSSRSIGWLANREPLEQAFALPRAFGTFFGSVLLSRSIQPDPDSPFRVGVTLARGPGRGGSGGLFRGERVFMALRPHRLTLCVTAVTPLTRRGSGGGNCGQRQWAGSFFPPDQPISVWAAEDNPQITRLYGIAADGVRAIDLYLASGRVIPAALRDNVYTVEAPTAQFPAKLVAYDAQHRPVMVSLPPETNRLVLAACPAASQPGPPAPAKPYERLDLGTLEVNGHKILGQTPTHVRAALGRPSHTETGYEHPGRYTAFFYGASRWRNAPLVVDFSRQEHGFRATTLWYAAANLVDPRLGQIMRIQPHELQQKVAAVYGSTYRRSVGYGQNPGQYGCTAVFRSRHSNTEIRFGIQPWLSTRPYLVIRGPR